MRAVSGAFILLALIASSPDSSRADEFQQTPYLAHVEGLVLQVWATGEKPCDFNRDKLINDAEFVLNAANLDFGKMGDANLDYANWPTLFIYAEALKTTYGCAWYLEVSVQAPQTGAKIFGIPYGNSVDIWESGSIGTSPGNGMTAYVSGFASDHLKQLVNDVRAAQKKYAATP